jgi:uncharacterized protein
MKQVCTALACALALAACVSAPRTASAPEPALWVVRDADSTLYLYGTIHMRKPGARWGGPMAERALAEADEVWTEVEVDPARDAAVQQVVARYGIDPANPLSAQLTPERAQQLREAAVALGAAPQSFDVMKPWLASITISLLPMLKAGYDPQAGVDRSVDRVAEAAGKRMRWFESGEQQIQFLAGLSYPLQIAMLEDALDEVGQGTALLERMEAAWEVGDDRTLAREMTSEMKRDDPELYEVMLTRRNAAWTETLIGELNSAGVDFVAVGAAHLVGPDSVQAMLRARGWKVERVR